MNSKAVEEFKKVLEVSDRLLGPGGCPWDREQTVVSMRESVLEEACEVIEAIDEGNNTDLIEELGDLLYNVVFFLKLGAKEGRFSVDEPLKRIREKLIYRHPHVFEKETSLGQEEVVSQWERLKKGEKPDRESLLDGIPKGMPALARAYKIAGKMEKREESSSLFSDEEELGELLWEVVRQAREQRLNPEMALRKKMVNEERLFREKEKGE